MRTLNRFVFERTAGLLILSAVVLAACERPPIENIQRGYRGLGMEANYNPRTVEQLARENVAPDATPPVPAAGAKAGDVYQNVQVLGDLSAGQFVRLMTSITSWVAPEQGCNYCHAGNDLASDDLYTKQVARQMILMTKNTNENWQAHVGTTGVTCYTCHRGKPIPDEVWSENPGPRHARGIAPARQNIAAAEVGYTSLPYDPFTPYFAENYPIRVQSDTPLPTGSRKSIKETEWTYGLMMHFSDALGVNCTHCHNSRAFGAWNESPPEREKAWHAIRMVQDANKYIHEVSDVLPANRKGPMGDPLQVNCKTCHQRVYRPLFGAQMARNYPSLGGVAGDGG